MVKIKKAQPNLCTISLYFLIITALFSGYIEHFLIWHILLWVDAILLLFFSNGFKILTREKSILGLLMLSMIFIFMNLIASNGLEFASSNIRSLSYIICIILILLVIVSRQPGLIEKIVFQHWGFLNVWFYINVFVLFKQVQGTGFMIKAKWLTQNPYYKDACAGLFGMDSTDIIGYYAAFILVLNLKYVKEKKYYGVKKWLIYIATFIPQAVNLYCFTLNDGNAFFIILPGIFALYLVAQVGLSKLTKKKIIAFGKYILIFILIIIAALSIPSVKEYIDNTLLLKLNLLLRFNSVKVSGSNERLAIAAEALARGKGWLLGEGIGYCKWNTPGAFGFRHFGISSIGCFIMLMGIWFYIVYSTLFASFMYSLSKKIGVSRGVVIFLMYLGITVFLTVYTYLFTEPRTLIMISLIIAVIISNSKKMNSFKRRYSNEQKM